MPHNSPLLSYSRSFLAMNSFKRNFILCFVMELHNCAKVLLEISHILFISLTERGELAMAVHSMFRMSMAMKQYWFQFLNHIHFSFSLFPLFILILWTQFMTLYPLWCTSNSLILPLLLLFLLFYYNLNLSRAELRLSNLHISFLAWRPVQSTFSLTVEWIHELSNLLY